MLKIVLLGAVFAIIYMLFFKNSRADNIKKDKKNDKEIDDTIQCSKCGTFVLKDDAILSNGTYVCSKNCM